MNTFVLPMDSVEATLDQIGGKGANLNRMYRAGFPVPPGFLITTVAYCDFVQSNTSKNKLSIWRATRQKPVKQDRQRSASYLRTAQSQPIW